MSIHQLLGLQGPLEPPKVPPKEPQKNPKRTLKVPQKNPLENNSLRAKALGKKRKRKNCMKTSGGFRIYFRFLSILVLSILV